MNVTFNHETSGVYLTRVNGKLIRPVLVYSSRERIKEMTVASALNSDLLGRITTAILKAGK